MSSPQQESFQSMATVFILQDKTWIERGSGLVRFVFDLRTFALRLVIRPGTNDEYECKLRPRIRSKGPRAYVVRAQAENGTDEHILAVRFEREEDSRSFRRFVEKRDVDNNTATNTNTKDKLTKNQTNYTNNQSQTLQSRYIDPMTAAMHPQQQQAQAQHHPHPNHTSPHPQYHRHPNNHRVQPSSHLYGHSYGQPSTSNVQQPGTTASNKSYFWTCSRCLQMVDPSLPSCHVCGTLRDSTTNQGNTTDQYQQQQPQQPHTTNGNNNNYHAYYNVHHTNQYQSHHQQQPSQPHNIHRTAHPTAIQQAIVLKLTTVNLEKHNKLFPSKRRNCKEVVTAQLEWLRTHQ